MSVGLLPSPSAIPSFHLLSDGQEAFGRILSRIDGARRKIVMRCFEWRDDETGDLVARALLRAAERGVAVEIFKDRVGAHYEYLEASRQSFFHKTIDLRTRVTTRLLMASYGKWGSLAQRPSPRAAALVSHPRVTVVRDRKRYDHSKLYVFDDERVILGGMGIGDDFRNTNVDFMVEVTGAEAVARLLDRQAGRAPFDGTRLFDFLLHAHETPAGALAAERLRLIASARSRLTIEMAYLGDRACTDALVAAVNRGVAVTLLTAARANIIADLNLHTCAELLRRTGSPEHLRIVLHPRMVHGKAIVGDGEWVDVGSTNFTPLSHGGYEEVDLFCRDRALARAVESAIESDARDGVTARLPVTYRRGVMLVERAVTAYQARRRPTP
jgi:cardiolipin synthase A/B